MSGVVTQVFGRMQHWVDSRRECQVCGRTQRRWIVEESVRCLVECSIGWIVEGSVRCVVEESSDRVKSSTLGSPINV